MLRLVLVSIHIKDSPQAVSLAAAMLKAKLDLVFTDNQQLTVEMLDCFYQEGAGSITKRINDAKADLVGFSTYVWNRHIVDECCRALKINKSDTVIFAGGAEATAQPLQLLKSAPFDFVIKGEGEDLLTAVITRILDNASYTNIAGVYTSCCTSPKDGDQPVLPVNLDELPSPFLSGTLKPEKYSGILWELSRGCPFKCSFCFESRGLNGVRQFSLERIMNELDFFEEHQVSQVFVLDPTFNRDKKRAKIILNEILNRAPFIHYTFEVRLEFIDQEMAELFARLHCSLQIGLQSVLPHVLKKLNRSIDPEKYQQGIQLLNHAGVVFGLDLIYGLPGDSLAGFKESLNYALALQPNHLDIFPLSVLPGTALYDEAVEFQLSYYSESPYTLISSPGFSAFDMSAAASLKGACELFYNRGGAAGWMFIAYETLELEPGIFLEYFSQFLKQKNISTTLSLKDITELQIDFTKEQFEENNLSELFPVMHDIIVFNGALNRALYAGPSAAEKNSVDSESIPVLAEATQLVDLHYNYNNLMSVGELSLDDFFQSYAPEKSFVVFYNLGGEIKPLLISEELFDALTLINGRLSFCTISDKLPALDSKELLEFMEYALQQQIIYIA